MRPNRDQWLSDMAELVARRSTCLRRSVGCVLVNRRGQVLATGYNGVARGQPHCNDEVVTVLDPDDVIGLVDHPHACGGAGSPSGTNLDACQAIHAEQNALLQCRDVEEIHTCYVTVSPCVTCTKLLLNTGCRRIVFIAPYAHDAESRRLWTTSDREWSQLA